ncbi:MAG: hypothetical protein JW904_09355 [Spirochaetales bacterium]|nr:hypothetical protein [Spirochaetales bacterium]
MFAGLSNTGVSAFSSGLSPRSNYLQGIDGAVKAHEKAHLLALGGFAKGGISYDYLLTSDGHKYAVGGSVGVDISPVPDDPKATIRKMRTVRAAALSPTHPSAADTGIASKTLQIEMQAHQQLKKEQLDSSASIGIAAATSADIPANSKKASTPASFAGSPETIIDKANAVQTEILISGDRSARAMQRLFQSYIMEMKAQKKLRAEDSLPQTDILI